MHHISGKPGIRRAALVLVRILALSSLGCIGIGGTEHYDAKSPTLGRQLADLKYAHDNGAINQTEYEQAKAKLLGGGQ